MGLFNKALGLVGRGEDPSPGELVAKAQMWISQNNLDEAMYCYDLALYAEPENKAALAGKAGLLSHMGEDAEAIEFFDRALVLDPDGPADAVIQAGKSAALFKLGRMADALESCNKALDMVPVNRTSLAGGQDLGPLHGTFVEAYRSELLTDKGLILNRLGMHDEALKCCEGALIAMPRVQRTLNCKGYAMYSLGRYGEALEVTDEVIDLDSGYLPVFLLRSLVLYKLGERGRALDIVGYVLRLDPDNEHALDVLDMIRNDPG